MVSEKCTETKTELVMINAFVQQLVACNLQRQLHRQARPTTGSILSELGPRLGRGN